MSEKVMTLTRLQGGTIIFSEEHVVGPTKGACWANIGVYLKSTGVTLAKVRVFPNGEPVEEIGIVWPDMLPMLRGTWFGEKNLLKILLEVALVLVPKIIVIHSIHTAVPATQDTTLQEKDFQHLAIYGHHMGQA